MSKEYYIVSEGPGGEKYKVAKIIFTKDGGFSLIPSHRNSNGLVYKNIVEYGYNGEHNYPIYSEDATYIVSNNVKLSVHHDGFVQFSSANQIKITSGRMKYSQLAKGVGIKISSLKTPITTGPTCTISVWGLNTYPTIASTEESKYLYLPQDSFIYNNCNEKNYNAYLFELKLFKKSQMLKSVLEDNGKYFLIKKEKNFLPTPNLTFNYRIINNNNADYLIGIIGSKILTNFKAPSGFAISGPTELIPPSFYPENKGISINAIFPSPLSDDSQIKKLDYIPDLQIGDYNK